MPRRVLQGHILLTIQIFRTRTAMRKTCSAGLTNNQMLLEAIMNVIEDQVYHHIEVYLAHVKGKIVVAYISMSFPVTL